MTLSEFEMIFYSLGAIIFMSVIISQVLRYMKITKYEKEVRKLLGKHYADYFDWDVMKNFYDFPLEPIVAAREMIAAGLCKPNKTPLQLTDIHGQR